MGGLPISGRVDGELLVSRLDQMPDIGCVTPSSFDTRPVPIQMALQVVDREVEYRPSPL